MTDKPELYLVNLLRHIPNTTANLSVCHAKMLQAADRIEALEAEIERLRAALEAIAVRAGTFEGRGSYIAYVELAGEIEKMADAARNGEEP